MKIFFSFILNLKVRFHDSEFDAVCDKTKLTLKN
jgi:hypothetical protein